MIVEEGLPEEGAFSINIVLAGRDADGVTHRFQDYNERFDPKIRAELQKWWKKATSVYDNDESGVVVCRLSGKRLDGQARSGANVLERDEYEMFYARLVHAFNHSKQHFLTASGVELIQSYRCRGRC